MKRNRTNCRHAKAFPTIVRMIAGFYWCPDCGAFRLCNVVGNNTVEYVSERWIYPTGHEDVCHQLELQEAD